MYILKDAEKIPLPELFKQLNTANTGLTKAEAEKRLAEVGENELPEKKQNPLLKFLSGFWGPIPWMIEAAALLSALIGHWPDFIIILTLLLVNAVVGFWEEYQAGNAIAALKAQLALNSRVKRDNTWQSVPARELVPGDVIHLHIGDIIPADVRLLKCESVQVDQSSLTGESLPVPKQAEDAVYSGSILKVGEADALVYGTGLNTFFGKTARLVGETHTTSHFQRAVLKIGDYLILLAVGLVFLILLVSLFRNEPIVTTLQFALILTVAAIPVAMPTVLSITMAVGARLLSKKQAIVSRLASIEELAGMDVLCSDKTGTLTQNKLSLGESYCFNGVTPDELILTAALASVTEDQDPIDEAIFKGLTDQKELEKYQVSKFKPFDPVNKRTEAAVETPDHQQILVSKGAAQVIAALSNDGTTKEMVNQKVDEFARRGFRSLAVARTDPNGIWQVLGVLSLYDPPRLDSKETIQTAEEMGIRVKMITGDQTAIGREIAQELEMGKNIQDASVLEQSGLMAGQTEEIIEKADGFAQVFPEHKYRIVDVLQKHEHIVGMTGDGVNDAPALKKADAGIAVSGATDAARAAADIVLMTPGLSVIIDAVKESRRIFQRMNSYAIYRITETIRILLFMTLSILVFNFYPVTAIMIVLLAILNDGAIISIAYDHVYYSQKPERWNLHKVLGIATILGVMGLIASFGLFYLAERVFHLDRSMIQTLIYLKLSVAGHLTIFITRTRKSFWSIKPSPILLGAVFGTQAIATLIAVYGVFMPAIGWGWALLVWVYALVWFLINDVVKQAAYKIFERSGD